MFLNLKKISTKTRSRSIAAAMFSLFAAFLCINPVQAADPNLPIKDESYAAKFVSQSVPDPITMEAGSTKEVSITFKNAGTATWNEKGSHYLSAYTVEPKYRSSPFKGSNWISSSQTGKITGTVAPGKTGVLKIQLKAPKESGTYTERFQLAAENQTWVKDGYFYLIIKVTEAKPGTTPTPTPAPTPAPDANAYKASRFIQNVKTIEAKGGDPIKLVLGFQNVGTASWKKVQIVSGSPTQLAGQALTFADKTWKSNSLVLENAEEIAPGKTLRNTLTFRAPRTKGNYNAVFTLMADGKAVGEAVVKVAVTDNAPLNYKDPFPIETDNEDDDDDSAEVPEETELPTTPRSEVEPRIRVGLDVDTIKALHFISYEDDYIVYSGTREKGELKKLKIGELRYADGVYSFKGGGLQFTTEDYIRLVPKNNEHAVFELMNMKRAMSWVGPGDFNQYRGAMEYRVGKVDGKKYAVNDLLFEDYVKGIAEFGKNDEMEFIKANVVAARSYAYVSLGKYSFFDVLATTYDQNYLGKKVEDYMPRATEAVEATRGMMVIYDDKVVVTPYFGNSNGKTKTWKEVWGGSNKPWLVPVKANYDAGKKQYGHGVGMSQRDANLRAKNEGLTWTQLLKYYYTGTSIGWIYR